MENNNYIFSFSDIKTLIVKKKKLYLIFFVIIFFLSILMFLFKPPIYEAKAIFYEDIEKSKTIGNLKDIVLSDNSNYQIDAFSFFKTQKIIKKLVSRLALQIEVVEQQNFFKQKFNVLKKNLEMDFKKNSFKNDQIKFINASYDGLEPIFYYLKILDEKTFEILDENRKTLGKAKLNQRINFSEVSFEIEEMPKSFINKIIKIKILPWENVVENVLKNLKVIKDKNSSFIFLKTREKSPYIAAYILNNLMDLYCDYLNEENCKVTKQQLGYLEERKTIVQKELDSFLDQYDDHLKENVRSTGLINFELEIAALLNQKDILQKKVTENIDEINIFKSINLQNVDDISILDDKLMELLERIKKLKNEDDILQRSLYRDILSKNNFLEKIISSYPSFLAVNDFQESMISQKIDLEKSILFSKSNKVFSRNYFLEEASSLPFLNLDNVNDLLIHLDQKKDEIAQDISQIELTKKKLNVDQYKIGFISIISFDLIKNILEISKKLENLSIYTSKELEVLKKEYELEKKYIIFYLDEKLNLRKSDLKLINEKIVSLKKTKRSLIDNEILQISSNAKKYVTNKLFLLNTEKKSLEMKLNHVISNIDKLVSRLDFENQIKMKIEMNKNKIESIEKLLESKKLDANLKQINSKPIDYAAVNFFYDSLCYFKSFIIAIGSLFLFFFFSIYFFAIKGFPLSKDSITTLGYDHLGAISFKSQGLQINDLDVVDLESLRKIISSIGESDQKIITAICSDGPNYIHYLSTLLAMMGKKIIVIETKSDPSEEPGLFSYLSNDVKKIPIQKLQAYDYLPSGGNNYFSFELLKSSSFSKILQQLKEKYDLIMIYSSSKINSAEARVYLDFSDKIILTIKNETYDDIKNFINKTEEKNKFCFITY